MNELLTTGEMIERLKVGQVAESENGDKVTRTESGSIDYTDSLREVSLTRHIIEPLWCILPNYVSFEKAMKALKQGRMVKLHGDNNLDVTVFRKWYKLESREDVTFDDLFNGKWTIEED